MSSRPYIVNRTANTGPTGQQLGDEWFDTGTNRLIKQVAVNGNAVTGAQVLVNINNSVVTTANITGGNFITDGTISATGTITSLANVTTPLITMTSAALAATAVAGTIAYDGNVMYSAVRALTRGAIPSEQIVVLTGNNTLTSQTAAQAIFDGGGGPVNGAVTLPVGTYQYELSYAVTGLGNGSFGFDLGGNATKTFTFHALATKAGTLLATPMAVFSTYDTAPNTVLVATSNGTTVGTLLVKGIIRVTVAGTIIPQISLTTAIAAVIQAGAYFKVSAVGNATVATVGNWS